jgi:hypothetical protein
MPTCGMAIVTRGMTYPPSRIDVLVCDVPVTQAEELRPSVSIDILPTPVVDPAPVVRSSVVVRPRMTARRNPPADPGAHPVIVEAPELRPVIIKAEEEE